MCPVSWTWAVACFSTMASFCIGTCCTLAFFFGGEPPPATWPRKTQVVSVHLSLLSHCSSTVVVL